MPVDVCLEHAVFVGDEGGGEECYGSPRVLAAEHECHQGFTGDAARAEGCRLAELVPKEVRVLAVLESVTRRVWSVVSALGTEVCGELVDAKEV